MTADPLHLKVMKKEISKKIL